MKTLKKVICPHCIGLKSMRSLAGIVNACKKCASEGYVLVTVPLIEKKNTTQSKGKNKLNPYKKCFMCSGHLVTGAVICGDAWFCHDCHHLHLIKHAPVPSAGYLSL